jgi:hypothetical protein
MALIETFQPAYTQGVLVSPGAASASSTIGRGSKSLVLSNVGSVLVYVRVGSAGISATTADYPVLPSTQVSIAKAQDFDTVAYIAPLGGGSLHIIPGEGF